MSCKVALMTGTRGRPRSEQARLSVLEAALRLCLRDGYTDVTIKGIADEAGVGRQTVYRWWPTKGEVLLEALTDLAARRTTDDAPTGDVLADLARFLRATFELADGVVGRAMVGVMAEAQENPELARRLSTLIDVRRQALRALLANGVAAGRFRELVPLDLVVDLVFGAMWYRMLNRHGPIDDALAESLVDVVRRLLEVPPEEVEKP